MLSGRLSGAQAPARAESGRPQNWSPAISGSPSPLKINKKSIFSVRNPSKTSCNLPRAPWKRHRAFWSRSKACGGPSSGLAPARAESGRPQNWSPAISSHENSMKNLYPQISLVTPKSLLEPPKCSLEDSPAPRRPRARRLAGLKTGPRLFLCAFTMIF